MISSTLLHSLSSFKFNPLLKLNHPSHAAIRPRLKPYPTNFTCRAVFSDDAPFAAAIGACMFTSLLLPASTSSEDDDADSAVTSTDARLAVMGILSFIPYFNWLSWIFAWLDTGKRRYAVYALVYLAPYLRSNLSLSPEESWLPIASILFCIVHIQLEASIRNGDIQGFQLFRNVADQLSSNNRKKGHLNLHQEMSQETWVLVEKKIKKKNKKKTKESEGKAAANQIATTSEKQNLSTSEKKGKKQTETKPSQVRTFPNGLIIEEVFMGKPDGKKAAPGKKVSVKYIGKLQKDGKIFDSNVGRAPFKFCLGEGQVIKGWDVGINGMRIGDKRRITIPPSMGYADKRVGSIPPSSWLVFDVELVDVDR